MSENFKTLDAASYDDAAAAFNQLSEKYSRPFADALVEFAEIPAAARVLDLGCGPGILGRSVKRSHSSNWVASSDLSRAMLQQARASGTSQLVQADAEYLGFQAKSVDGVVSLFLMRHLPDPLRALRACREILTPGGSLGVGLGGGPLRASWDGVADAARRLGALAAGANSVRLEAPAMLISLMNEMGLPQVDRDDVDGNSLTARQIVALVSEAGFSQVRSHWVGRDFLIESSKEFWELQTTFSTHVRKRLSLCEAAVQRQLKDEFFKRCDRSTVELRYPCGVLMIRAKR